ncbi:TIGR02710 family CRISPR-associated protein [Methylomonas paludis]|uniref:TIGR02710 family CRISPR-associated protein n=1 Tax=Methylomonas paludis TaxID=1173101 RepID=A0A975R9Y0_9GAMM|nr:TIGR02710 family CRISPR-associated CARF protein [Methylomonas paludis]QWF71552.1 TIGR02710 family CRISPR-associated protein [Methylomonas paludis]
MTPTILICTVGGSHQPIVSAINEVRPDHVVFICTDKDLASGQPGSKVQIIGVGNCIKAQFTDAKPTLPNIPTQTGLNTDQYQVCISIADDLDAIYQTCTVELQTLAQRFPGAHIIADYTGGTKSMSAGLVMAALEWPEVKLQLVTGSRADLIKVYDGSQYSAQANSSQIRFERQIAPFRQAWSRYAYSEAYEGLRQITAPTSPKLRSQYTRFRELSRAFAEWDNFNHPMALDILQKQAGTLNNEQRRYIGCATRLNDLNATKQTAARLLDLYLNAQRRAAQGRYDDAIARIYRLLEWTAQWLLLSQTGIETANVPAEQIPAGLSLTQNREGQWQAALHNAWQLVAIKTDGPATAFFNTQKENLLHHLQTRNSSILAHGFAPINRQAWESVNTWIEQCFLPVLLAEAKQAGIPQLPPQLPNNDGLNLVTG